MAKEESRTQLNVMVPLDVAQRVDQLANEFGWTQRQTVVNAIRCLDDLLCQIGESASNAAPGTLKLFRRVAAEKPVGFVEIADGIKFGQVAGDLPAVKLPTGWVVYPGESGELLAVEEETGRAALIVDGEIKPLKLPSPDEVTLN
jgi:hypothetical protein